MKKLICLLQTLALISIQPLAVGGTLDVKIEKDSTSRSSEYIFRNYPDEPLISVRVLGGVKNPGVYHIPKGTDVVTLMSVTGGIFSNANLKDIVLRKPSSKVIRNIDLNSIISDVDNRPHLMDSGDVLFVNLDKPMISNDTMTMTLLISAILGMVATGVAIHNGTK